MMHAAFRQIRTAFPKLTMSELFSSVQEFITMDGSLIMPAFTYCFKKSDGGYDTFEPDISASRVGAVSENFRTLSGVIRTSSPTHSFCLWGEIQNHIPKNNSPDSPLGKGSVLHWLAENENTFFLLLGTDFNSLSFGHYLEITAPVLWAGQSCWKHLNVENSGVSIHGEQPLIEVPGCSKSFRNFETFLLENDIIQPAIHNQLKSYFISAVLLLEEGLPYFRRNPEQLLCPLGECRACDERWEYYLIKHKESLL